MKCSVANKEAFTEGPGGKTPFRLHYIVLGAICLLFLGLVYAWSIFRTPLQTMFPDWTASNISFGFSLLMLFFCIGSFTAGRLSKKMTPRALLLLAAFVVFFGFLFASTIHESASQLSLIKVYIGYCSCSGFAAGIGQNTMLGIASRWYPDRQGLASGIILMAYGLGAVVLGSIARELMNRFGVADTYHILAVAALLVLGITALFLRNPPAGTIFPKPFNSAAKRASDVEVGPRQVVRTSAFWIYFIWATLKGMAGVLVVQSAASISEYYGAAAVVGLIVSVTNAASRFIFGTSIDRAGFRKTVWLNNFVMLAAGILMLTAGLTRSVPVLVIGLLMTGAGFGSTPAISAVFFRRMWGARNYQSNYSLATLTIMLSSLVGPAISGYMQDHTAAGADPWISTFIAMLITCVLSVFFGALCARKTNID